MESQSRARTESGGGAVKAAPFAFATAPMR
jgi:hypothetical protein